jgi:hypothetical protein
MVYLVKVHWDDGTTPALEVEVEGWRIDDPPGWVQLVESRVVTFIHARNIRALEVPNLTTVEAPPDEEGPVLHTMGDH